MNTAILIAIYLGIPFGLLLLGYTAGRINDRAHTKKLLAQLVEMDDILVTQLKTFPNADSSGPTPQLVCGEVVIANDYLKMFLASLKNIYGGEVTSCISLMARARNDVLVQLLVAARDLDCNAICNVRFMTADISSGTAPSVALIATGTAYRAAK